MVFSVPNVFRIAAPTIRFLHPFFFGLRHPTFFWIAALQSEKNSDGDVVLHRNYITMQQVVAIRDFDRISLHNPKK